MNKKDIQELSKLYTEQKELEDNSGMKNISVWYNRFGVDEKFFEGKGEWNQEMLNKIIDNVPFVEGAELDDFDIEEEGDSWTMYSFDGIGVFVVDEGEDPERCKEEYDKGWDW